MSSVEYYYSTYYVRPFPFQFQVTAIRRWSDGPSDEYL